MALKAESCGLDVLYSGFFTMAANRSCPLRKMLGCGRGHRVVMTPVLGYPGVTYL